MDNLTLINQIDEQLGQAVDAPRQAHYQIQQLMEEFRQHCQREQERQAAGAVSEKREEKSEKK
jgi:hypothetical protein